MRYLILILLLSGCGQSKKCINGELYDNTIALPMWYDKTYVQYPYIKGMKCSEVRE